MCVIVFFLLCAGDYASMLSGGHLHSPVHRVVLPEESHRASFVFFFYPKCVPVNFLLCLVGLFM